MRGLVGVLLAAVLSFLAFRVFQPYAFEGPSFFGLRPNPKWLANLQEIRNQSGGSVDAPFALQWAYRPRFLFSWPNAQTAVMGAEQAALTMAIVMEAGMKRKGQDIDHHQIDEMRKRIVDNFERQQNAFVTSALLLDDGIIDPRDTRNVLGFALSICKDGDARTPRPIQFGVARP